MLGSEASPWHGRRPAGIPPGAGPRRPNADLNAIARISRIGTMAGTPAASPRAMSVLATTSGSPRYPRSLTTKMRDPSWCSEGSMPPERIREIREIAIQSALGLAVVETSRPGRLRPSANSMD